MDVVIIEKNSNSAGFGLVYLGKFLMLFSQ
jgi:hypothetical protein